MTTTRTTRRTVIKAAAAAAALALPSRGLGQGVYPQKAVRMVVPLAAGGVMDSLCRIVAEQLGSALGQSVIVENKPGANGMIAASAVATAEPDGYTILATISSIVQNVALQKNPGYRIADLVALAPLGGLPVAFAVPNALGPTTLREFVALAKTRPQPLSYGSYGMGSASHIIAEAFMRSAGVKLVQVPFRGEAPALTAIIGGHVDSVLTSVGGAASQAATIRMLAVANNARLSRYPDLPTFEEAGYPVGGLTGWSGVFAPVATPRPIVDRLRRELNRITQAPTVRDRMLEFGFEPMDGVMNTFPDFVDAEVRRWAAAIREYDITVN